MFDGENEVALTDEEPEKDVEYENPMMIDLMSLL